MKRPFTLFILFITFFSYSQENCTNGIDDDNDGLIDLNDPDCNCHTFTQIPSIIPNPSFELYNYCPSSFSQMNALQNWIQATAATSDYYNVGPQCNFATNALIASGLTASVPDGHGFVGALYINNWKEYVGTTLSSTMLAGTTYRLQFNVGALLMYNNGDTSQVPVSTLPATNITLYGCANGSNLPLPTTGSPNTADPTWVVIGQVSYTPATVWSTQIIEFTPTFNVNAVMLGPAINLPPGYPLSNQSMDLPYFVYDNLLLNRIDFFNSVTVDSTGDFCSNNVVLHSTLSNPNPTYTYQWYNNGVAIVGATSSTLPVSVYNANDLFSVIIFDGTNCIVSNSIHSPVTQPAPPTTNPVTYCQNDAAVPLTATGSNLLWYTNATGGTGSTTAMTPVTSNFGNFTYYVSQSCNGLESLRVPIIVTVTEKKHPDFVFTDAICFGGEVPLLNTTSPNGVSGSWNPETVNNTQSLQYTFTPNTAACAFPQSIDISVIPPINFHLEGGCNMGQYYLNAIPETGSFDLNALHFTWTNSNGTTIGGNEPSINLTEIVNNTPEEEQFPLTFGLTITDSNNCSFYNEYSVDRVFCNIQKGISANADGDNDFFDLRGLDVSHLDIYNRYGMIVYSKDDYTTEWKGQSDNGDNLPSSTYYYRIQFDSETKTKVGWIYLIR